jgi:hypothetical protein
LNTRKVAAISNRIISKFSPCLLPLNYQEHPPPQVQWFTQIRMENIYNAKKNLGYD